MKQAFRLVAFTLLPGLVGCAGGTHSIVFGDIENSSEANPLSVVQQHLSRHGIANGANVVVGVMDLTLGKLFYMLPSPSDIKVSNYTRSHVGAAPACGWRGGGPLAVAQQMHGRQGELTLGWLVYSLAGGGSN